MRRPNEEHTAQPWQVHDQARDFELLDVWRFPIVIDGDIPFSVFPLFLAETLSELQSGAGPAALLFRLRRFLGRVFGWDGQSKRDGTPEPLGFTSVYEDDNERLAEIQNATVHALLHLGRVPLGPDRGDEATWSPQMAVYVKPRGRFGRFYMALIGPFRHWIVYPAMMRAVARAWPGYVRSRKGQKDPAQKIGPGEDESAR